MSSRYPPITPRFASKIPSDPSHRGHLAAATHLRLGQCVSAWLQIEVMLTVKVRWLSRSATFFTGRHLRLGEGRHAADDSNGVGLRS
jgi:hypothetical protein